MSAPLTTVSPLTYTTWLKYQEALKPDSAPELYTEYLHEWYRNNTTVNISNTNLIKQNYIQLLKDLSFLFGTQEKDLFLANIDYTNDEEIVFAIPYFVKKLKEICKILSYKREAVKNAKLKYNLVGSNQGLEKLLYEFVLNGFTKKENNITQVPISSLALYFPHLSGVNGNFFIELEELHDSQSYHDSDPSVSINEYVDAEQITNEIPFENISENEILGLLSTRYLSRVADTPLSRLFNQYLLEIPTLSTAALSSVATNLIYNEIAASQKYLGETVYGLTAVRLSEIDTPDFILNLDFKQGNNWFYWPSGDRIIDDSRFNNIYAPIAINDTNFVASSATGGTDLTDSDLIFTDKIGVVEGAWLQGPRTEYSVDDMQMSIPAGVEREFIYPYPGFKIISKGSRWGGHAINDADYIIYEKLLPEQRKVILTEYYTQSLPNSASLPLYINDTNLVYSDAYAGKFSDVADVVNKKSYSNTINKIFSEALSGISEEAFLFKFDKTDIPISVGINDIAWPIGRYDSNNIPITITNDTCLPIKLGETNPLKTIPGAIAGNEFDTADIIYKMNTRTGDPIEAAWLGSGSVANLNLDSKISVYNTPATNCAAYIDGPVQGALATLINPSEKISFIWMDEDTPADEVIFYREHAADCPYLKDAPHNYYRNQDYQNPTPLNDLQSWTKCRCKSVYYSPIGNTGNTLNDYNGMADYLFADPQGLAEDFALNTWVDTRGYTPYTSPQFSFYHLDGNSGDNEIGWGTGYWKTGDGSPMILKTGRRYTYYRTSLRKAPVTNSTNSTASSPYIVVNYPYKNIKGNYSNTSKFYDITIVIDKSKSENDNINNILNSVNQFVDGLLKNSSINVQISIVSFSKSATIATYLTSDLNSIKFAIDSIDIPSTYPDYRTDIYSALQMANGILTTTIIDNEQPQSLFDLCNNLNATILKAGSFKTTRNIPRNNATKTIILFSDGYENINVGKAVPYAQQLITSGIDIFGIDIGTNSYFTTNMEQIASTGGFFNLQNYLDNNDGDINSFVQYLLSKFSGNGFSVVPTWYKAIRDINGNWSGINQISDMVLNSGDFLSFVHRSAASYSGPNNTSFSTPAISFAFNIKLNGWDYVDNFFSKFNTGNDYGAKPFWAKSYTTPQTNIDTNFDKENMSFGGQVRFIDEYLPIHQPEISDMILSNGSYLKYSRRGTTNLVWEQPLTFAVSLSDYSWNKIVFYKDVSNLSDMFRSGNNIDIIAYSSPEPSDIVFEGYSSFLPAKYNYYARNDFSLVQDLYYTDKCLTSFVQFNTAIAVEAVQPYANLDNIHYPTVATVSIPSMAKSDKQTGEYLVPEKLGVSYYRGRGYSMRVSGDTLSFIDSISAERLFLDVEKYGPRHRGLTKNDQYSPVVIDEIDSRWMMQSYSSSSAAGTIVDVLNNQKFTPYQSKYEIIKKNNSGISRQNDQFDFWTNSDPAFWNKPEKYPLTFRNELLASSYADRKVELLVNKGEVVDWKADIFGNDYGLIKVPGVSASIPNIKAVSFDTIITQNNLIDLGCGGGFIGSYPSLSGIIAGGVTLSGTPIIATFPSVSSTISYPPLPPTKKIIKREFAPFDINWVTTTNNPCNNPNPWVLTKENTSIRYNIEDSANCGGTCGATQSGTATANIQVGDDGDVLMYLNFSGIGELEASNFELMNFYLDGQLIAKGRAAGGGLGCLCGPIIQNIIIPSPYLLKKSKSYTFNIQFTTNDGLFHVNSYYQVDLTFA
jgi:hypothetical protein